MLATTTCLPSSHQAVSPWRGVAGKMKTYFSEDAKASVDEVYSRWASFLGQVDMATGHINEDRKRAEARMARHSKAA